MGGYQNYGYYPDPEEERRQREMDLTQDPEALAGIAGVRPPTMDLTQDPEALQGSPDWQKFNQSRAYMRGELDDPPPTMDLTRDPEALNSPMLRQQAAARPQPPAAAGMPSQGSLASLLPQRDPQMDSRWRTAENTALDRSGYMGNQPYGAGEAVRDFAPMAIGGTLDILLNKGRGLGALSGAAMNANALQEKNRQEQAKNAGSFALQARDQRSSNSRANVAAQTEARQQQLYDLQNNPDNPQTVQLRESIYNQFPELRGKFDDLTSAQLKQQQALINMQARSAFNPQLAKDQGNISEERQRGTYRAQDEHYPTELGQRTQIAGDSAAASTAATSDVTHAYAPRTAADAAAKERALIAPEVEKRVAFEDAGVGAGQGMSGHMDVNKLMASNPGIDFKNPELVQEAIRTRALTRDVLDKMSGANRSGGVLEKLYKAVNDFQDAAHGDGTLTERAKAAWKARRTYNSMAEEYAGAMQQITGNKSDSAKAGFLKLVPMLADPTAPEGVKALWDSIAANTEGNLGTYGMHPHKPSFLGGEDAVPTQPPAAAPSGAGLGVTGGRKVSDTPPLPADVYRAGNGARQAAGKAPMSGGSVNQVPMAKPNGDGSFDIDGETYTADEVQKLKLKGLIR